MINKSTSENASGNFGSEKNDRFIIYFNHKIFDEIVSTKTDKILVLLKNKFDGILEVFYNEEVISNVIKSWIILFENMFVITNY